MRNINSATTTKNIIATLLGANIKYDTSLNMYRTDSYTSVSGYRYYQAAQASDKIVVKFNLCDGTWHTFVDGVQVFGFSGNATSLIGSREFSNTWYDNDNDREMVLDAAIQIIADYLTSSAAIQGQSIAEDLVNEVAHNLFADAVRKTRETA